MIRHRARRSGATEYTPDMMRAQFAKRGAAVAAFEPDGSLLGSSLMVVNQRPS